jgi:hypothetical protein
MSIWKWLIRLLSFAQHTSVPEGWTEDMTFPLPDGVTEEQIVDLVIDAALSQTPDDQTEQRLVTSLGLDPADAALARDRVYGGIFRAATRNPANRPDRSNDPLAFLSFQRAFNDGSIVARVYPQFTNNP